MMTLLMTFFIILCLILLLFIFIQQGKGDMGISPLGGASQTLFGGSGGQEFFARGTWIMGALFMLGALGISILRTNYQESKLQGFHAPAKTEQAPAPTTQAQDVAQK